MSYAISASSPISWSRSASTRRLSPPSSWRSATLCAARELALDEIARRFGLKDVELAVEHRAASELTGSRQPRAARDQRADHGRRHDEPAVRDDLDRVLAGERRRRVVADHDRLIERSPAASRTVDSVAVARACRASVSTIARAIACALGPDRRTIGERAATRRRRLRDDRLRRSSGLATVRLGHAGRAASAWTSSDSPGSMMRTAARQVVRRRGARAAARSRRAPSPSRDGTFPSGTGTKIRARSRSNSVSASSCVRCPFRKPGFHHGA